MREQKVGKKFKKGNKEEIGVFFNCCKARMTIEEEDGGEGGDGGGGEEG
jgi:hypothetical protein